MTAPHIDREKERRAAKNAYELRLIDQKEYLDMLKDDTGDAAASPSYKIGDLVKKRGDKGQWHGKIVGIYSASCTPVGYAVESLLEEGSVQIYPEAALEHWCGPAPLFTATQVAMVDALLRKCGKNNATWEDLKPAIGILLTPPVTPDQIEALKEEIYQETNKLGKAGGAYVARASVHRIVNYLYATGRFEGTADETSAAPGSELRTDPVNIENLYAAIRALNDFLKIKGYKIKWDRRINDAVTDAYAYIVGSPAAGAAPPPVEDWGILNLHVKHDPTIPPPPPKKWPLNRVVKVSNTQYGIYTRDDISETANVLRNCSRPPDLGALMDEAADMLDILIQHPQSPTRAELLACIQAMHKKYSSDIEFAIDIMADLGRKCDPASNMIAQMERETGCAAIIAATKGE